MWNSVGSRMTSLYIAIAATGCYIPHGVVPNPGAWLGLPNTETLNTVAHTINEALKVGPLRQQPAKTGSD